MTNALPLPPPAPFGTVLGIAQGNVPIYSCDYNSADESLYPDRHAYRNYIDDIFIGYKWQCVEFARRWLYLNKGYTFDDIAMAYDIFHLRSVRVISSNELLPLHSFNNGSIRRPEPGCLLIWDEGGEFEKTGHVAIVSDVHDDHIYFVEQNMYNHVWPEGQTYSRSHKVSIDENGGYFIHCEFDNTQLLGWVIQTNDDQFSIENNEIKPELLNYQPKEVLGEIKNQASWLDETAEDEMAYITMMKGHKMSSNPEDLRHYFWLSESGHREIKHASNELHALFMHATDYVLQNDHCLEKFNIPSILWPRIRKSWANRRNEMIVGRIDLSVSEKGVKVYEYNADSASCLMECGKIQGKWAKHFGATEGIDAGKDIFYHLVNAWKKSNITGTLHIMQDHDLEESYHARYIKTAMEAAGITVKILKGLTGLKWGKDHTILDPEGTSIQTVWKTWAWETALDQIRAQLEEQEASLEELATQSKIPRLVDVLLNPDIMVHEPLWTLIPSNKAILPILWQLFPRSPYLLNAQYTLTDDLKKSGYVIKPIVGRCGANISMVDKNAAIIDETSGKFNEQNLIYQALFKLPEVGKQNIQTNTFMVDGKYAGTCVRVDSSAIMTGESNILDVRIVNDELI